MEDLGEQEVGAGSALCGDEDLRTPSDAADPVEPPKVGQSFAPFEREDGRGKEQAETAQDTIDLTGGCGCVPCGQRCFGSVEEEVVIQQVNEATHETVDLTGSSGLDGISSSFQSAYKKRFEDRCFGPVEEEEVNEQGTEPTHETVDLTGSSAQEEKCSSVKFGYKKKFRGRKGSEVRVGPPRELGAVEKALRSAETRKTKYILEPVVSTAFDSLAEAYEFYNLYSWEVGFGVRYGPSYTNREGYKTSQDLVCQLEGRDRREQNDSPRCECKAMIRLHRSDDHGWFVETNRPDHNHQLSDNCGEKMQWNSHKKIDQATKDTVRCLRENNVSLSRVHCILGSMHSSVDKLPFPKKALRTICQQIAFEQKDDDIKKTLDIFRQMRSADPDFDFRFDLDPEGRIRNLIWTTGRSRRQYTCFGDVVVFDTTYTTNLYKMPFGLFVGVNNHFQTVIYAGILMAEETVEGFNWAYKEFVSLMGGKAPLTMLTDQARAMEVAIAMSLPGTVHRWCKWHVFKKIKEELGGIFSKQTGFKEAFNNVVNEMLTEDEFERGWEKLIEEFGLAENGFMVRVFEARQKWAKPYFKDKYCARMTSTQRVESANHMLKTYVPRHSSMNKFVSQYNKLLKDRNEAEDSEEHKNKQANHKERGGWPIEKHARRIYTRAVMKHFKAELDRGQNFNPPRELESKTVYELEHAYAHLRPDWARTKFKVRVEGGQRFDCECGLFGHFGILCSHVIRLMIHLGMREIPEHHIMKRWTKSARDILGPNVEGAEATGISLPSSFRHNIMYVSALEMVKMGDAAEAKYHIVMKHISAAKKELRESDALDTPLYYSSCGEDAGEPRRCSERSTRLEGLAETGAMTSDGVVIKEPLIKRGRGRPKGSRFKSYLEAGRWTSKPRSCGDDPATEETVDTPTRPDGLTKQTKYCKRCRKPGHNSATCTNGKSAAPSNADDVVSKKARKKNNADDVVSKKARKKNRCRKCNGLGHNSATCTVVVR